MERNDYFFGIKGQPPLFHILYTYLSTSYPQYVNKSPQSEF